MGRSELETGLSSSNPLQLEEGGYYIKTKDSRERLFHKQILCKSKFFLLLFQTTGDIDPSKVGYCLFHLRQLERLAESSPGNNSLKQGEPLLLPSPREFLFQASVVGTNSY